jgi:hypothetical protein
MENVILACLMFLLFCGKSQAEPVNQESDDLQSNKTLLESQCGYSLDKDVLMQVSKSFSKVNDKEIFVDFYISLMPVRRTIHGKLSFGCLKGGMTGLQQVAQKTTAADEITLEDSGGRYARNIEWQRKYEGNGWPGTIAYVNSVSRDQSKKAVPDYFFVCPNKDGLACFSYEVEKTPLERKEIDQIPELLHGISFTNPPKRDSQ